MRFPIDVIRIEDKIVLMQGQITADFKRKLRALNDRYRADYGSGFTFIDSVDDEENMRIDLMSSPELGEYNIYINGDSPSKSYKFASEDDFDLGVDRQFQIFKDCIKYYSEVMGYDV